jgi:integrase
VHPKVRPIGALKARYVRVADALFLNTETGIYYARKTFRRYRIPDLFESTRETKIARAKAKRDQLISDHLAKYLRDEQPSSGRRAGKTAAAVIDEILDTVTPSKRKGTQENHKLYLGELRKEWGRWDISRITLAAWVDWLKAFRARKRRKTFADYAKHMNLILRYAYRQRYVTHLLVLPNPDPKGKSAGRVFSDEEIKSLWSVMSDETRDQFSLSFECFMRLREALYLTWERVDLETGVLTLRPEDVKTGSKTGKGRVFVIPNWRSGGLGPEGSTSRAPGSSRDPMAKVLCTPTRKPGRSPSGRPESRAELAGMTSDTRR